MLGLCQNAQAREASTDVNQLAAAIAEEATGDEPSSLGGVGTKNLASHLRQIRWRERGKGAGGEVDA